MCVPQDLNFINYVCPFINVSTVVHRILRIAFLRLKSHELKGRKRYQLKGNLPQRRSHVINNSITVQIVPEESFKCKVIDVPSQLLQLSPNRSNRLLLRLDFSLANVSTKADYQPSHEESKVAVPLHLKDNGLVHVKEQE